VKCTASDCVAKVVEQEDTVGEHAKNITRGCQSHCHRTSVAATDNTAPVLNYPLCAPPLPTDVRIVFSSFLLPCPLLSSMPSPTALLPCLLLYCAPHSHSHPQARFRPRQGSRQEQGPPRGKQLHKAWSCMQRLCFLRQSLPSPWWFLWVLMGDISSKLCAYR